MQGNPVRSQIPRGHHLKVPLLRPALLSRIGPGPAQNHPAGQGKNSS